MNWLCFFVVVALAGCAGTSPDFSARTSSASDKQGQLAQWLEADQKGVAIPIVAPVCSSVVGHPPMGWAIDGGTWCVVSCPVKPENNKLDRWMLTHDGLRCYATDQKATALVATEYEKSHWRLDQQPLFKGFDRSFVNDTEWRCIEKEYRIDPESRKGFWADVSSTGNTYRFYSDGALMIGRGGAAMKFAGDWRGRQNAQGMGKGVLINDQEVFRFAVNYGGGRFDEFRTATRKQVCRFKDNPGPRVPVPEVIDQAL